MGGKTQKSYVLDYQAQTYLGGSVIVAPVVRLDENRITTVGQSIEYKREKLRLQSENIGDDNAKFTLQAMGDSYLNRDQVEKSLEKLGFRGKNFSYSEDGKTIVFEAKIYPMAKILEELQQTERENGKIKENPELLPHSPTPRRPTPPPQTLPPQIIPDPSHRNKLGALDIDPAEALGSLPSPSGERSGGTRGLA